MASVPNHTNPAFDNDIDKLHALTDKIGKRAQKAIDQAIKALQTGDAKLAKKVVEQDAQIDKLEQKIDQLAIRTLALRAPMADDLRDVVAVLKIAAVVERIGDYAKNVAKRIPQLEKREPETIDPLIKMGSLAADLVAMALTAFKKGDSELAKEIAVRDDDIDNLYSKIFTDSLGAMAADASGIAERAHALFIAKHLERIGDHATNIAEFVHYAATGEAMPERTDA